MLILDVNLMIFPINEIFQQFNKRGFGETPAKPVINTLRARVGIPPWLKNLRQRQQSTGSEEGAGELTIDY
jgi:hypothetical protein